MTTDPTIQAYAAALGAEHRELRRKVHMLEQCLLPEGAWTREGVAQATTALRELRNSMMQHFAQEERGGYLEEALAVAPRFASQAVRLLKQHGELLVRLDRLIDMAAAARESESAWEDLTREGTDWIRELLAHEAGENQVVQQAFNTDVGIAD